MLKSLSGKKNNPITIDELKVNDAVVKDKAEIVEAMNDAFINIASRISQGNQNNAEFDGEKLVDFVKPKIDKDCFEIPPITTTQVLAALNSMPSNKSTGCDGLSARVLKLAAPVLTQPFCRLMNYSISSGTFPIQWKTAKVTPLHKSGSRDDADNYRRYFRFRYFLLSLKCLKNMWPHRSISTSKITTLSINSSQVFVLTIRQRQH